MYKKSSWWSSLKKKVADLLYLITFAIAFIAVGSILLSLPSLKGTAWQTIAGALLVGGFTILVTVITARQSTLEQYKKEANLQRKTDVYGPLHTELKTLRETFDKAHAGTVPYPRWIEVAGVDRPGSLRFANAALLPTFSHWPTFKADYRIDNFSPDAQKLLNKVQNCAVAYDEAMEDARKVVWDLLRPHIAASVAKEEQSPKYQAWLRKRTGNQQENNRWFDFINLQTTTVSPDSPLGDGLAQAWSVKIGWLIGDNPAQAALDIYNGEAINWDAAQHSSLSWFLDIFEAATNELELDPTYDQVQRKQRALYTKLREAEAMLYQGLIYIRDRYEGGAPPI